MVSDAGQVVSLGCYNRKRERSGFSCEPDVGPQACAVDILVGERRRQISQIIMPARRPARYDVDGNPADGMQQQAMPVGG